MPWFMLSVFEASVLIARTRLLSLVGPWLWKVRECSNASATVMFCRPSAVVLACSRMLSASCVVCGRSRGWMSSDVRMCVAKLRYGTSRMISNSRRAKLCSREPFRICFLCGLVRCLSRG